MKDLMRGGGIETLIRREVVFVQLLHRVGMPGDDAYAVLHHQAGQLRAVDQQYQFAAFGCRLPGAGGAIGGGDEHPFVRAPGVQPP